MDVKIPVVHSDKLACQCRDPLVGRLQDLAVDGAFTSYTTGDGMDAHSFGQMLTKGCTVVATK